jgi:phosphoribosylglycinamide formyltransferase-1
MSPDSLKTAVFVSGGGSNLQALIDAGCNVCLVVSSNPGAFALERAKNSGIPYVIAPLKNFSDAKERDEFILKELCRYGIEFVVLAGYLGILTDVIVAAYERKIINVHPALLPKFGGKSCHGLNVHKAVIEAKERFSGATVHYVDLGVDTGEIIAQEKLEVLTCDTPESLQERILNTIEHKLLARVVCELTDRKRIKES